MCSRYEVSRHATGAAGALPLCMASQSAHSKLRKSHAQRPLFQETQWFMRHFFLPQPEKPGCIWGMFNVKKTFSRTQTCDLNLIVNPTKIGQPRIMPSAEKESIGFLVRCRKHYCTRYHLEYTFGAGGDGGQPRIPLSVV